MARSDRPLARKLFRLWLLMRQGRRMAHAQDWLPGLDLPKDGDERRILWKGREAGRTLSYASFAASLPAEVTIYGSGPSIGDLTLSAADGPGAILLNGSLSLIPRIGAPFAFFAEDERFVWRHFAMIRDLLPPRTPAALSVSVLRTLLTHDPHWAAGRRIWLIDNLEKPYAAPRRSLDAPELAPFLRRGGDAALSADPGRGVVACGTVAFSALQFALAARPRAIRLAGVDLSNAGQPRFYEKNARTAAKSGILSAQDRILAHFRLALAEAGAAGTRLCTASARSALTGVGYAVCQAPGYIPGGTP